MSAVVYTAFGERISGSMSGPSDRYGYAGSWGYQAHDDFPFVLQARKDVESSLADRPGRSEYDDPFLHATRRWNNTLVRDWNLAPANLAPTPA